MRRLALPLLLAVVVAGCAVAALRFDRSLGATAAEVDLGRRAVTPVLSARRVPEYTTASVADLSLRLELLDALRGAPADTCLAVDAGGREIIAHQSDRSLLPASNAKTLLAHAAVDVLGPDHRFETAVFSGAPPASGVVEGDLWLVGGGDPVLTTAPYAALSDRHGQAATDYAALADAIVDAGVERVAGGIVADESRYDSERVVAQWPGRFATQNQSGPLSALSINDGYERYPSRAAPGAPLVTAEVPPVHAGQVLLALLADRGVTVDGGVTAGGVPADAAPLTSIRSAPLSDIVAQMLTWSDNQTAELVLKEVGLARTGSGTTAAGADAVEAVLDDAGFPTEGVDQVDGSGLAGSNRLTCSVLTTLLAENGVDSTIGQGLAVAGRSGTLASAFKGTKAEGRLRAKTGSLNESVSLAGVVEVPRSKDLAFALVINRSPFVEPGGRALRDEVGRALGRYPDRPPLDDVAPLPPAAAGDG